jgi:hypothetical protein
VAMARPSGEADDGRARDSNGEEFAEELEAGTELALGRHR